MTRAAAIERWHETNEVWERRKADHMRMALAAIAPYVTDGTTIRITTETRPSARLPKGEEYIVYASISTP